MKRKRRTGLIIFSILVIIVVVRIGGIIHQRFDKTSTKTVRLGLVGTDSEPVWDNVRKRLKKQGINIEYVVFNDYVQPDVALKEGKIDMHSCLTRYYFESYNREQNAHLTSIGNTVISPLGVYSHKYQKNSRSSGRSNDRNS